MRIIDQTLSVWSDAETVNENPIHEVERSNR